MGAKGYGIMRMESSKLWLSGRDKADLPRSDNGDNDDDVDVNDAIIPQTPGVVSNNAQAEVELAVGIGYSAGSSG